MRGEPGDAMARMKRWDAVRQRLTDQGNVSAEAAVDEVVRAVSEIVQRHRSLTVTVTVDDSANNVTVRIRNGDGQLEVTRLEPSPIVGDPRPTVMQPRIVANEPRAVTTDPRVAVNEPRGMAGDPHANQPQAWPPRPSESPRQPEVRLPYRQPEPFRPVEQSRQGETMDQTAARLAEMIRRDPSLLEVRPVHDPEDRP